MRLGLGLALTLGGSQQETLWSVDLSVLTAGKLTAAGLTAIATGLVLTRASGSATYQTSASTVCAAAAYAAADESRVQDVGGGKVGLLVEETRTNRIADTRSMSGTGWLAGSGVTTTATYATSPDGTTNGTRCQVPSGGYSRFTSNSGYGAGAAWCVSTWVRTTASATDPSRQTTGDGGTALATGTSTGGSDTWSRQSVKGTTAAGTTNLIPVDGRNQSGGAGGIAAEAHDNVVDLFQGEVGSFPTSLIITTGAAATRAGERLRHTAPSTLISSGRLALYLTFYPLGASTEYTGTYRLWTIDANNYAEVTASTRVVTVVVAGVSRTLGALPTWSRLDKLEVFVAAGGSTSTTVGSARVNGGATTDLGSATAQSIVDPGANSLDILCNSTSAQFTSMVSGIAAYASGRKPSFAAAA